MADKLTFDFEKEEIIWDSDARQGTEACPGLAKLKWDILKVIDYGPIDLTKEVQAVNDFANGKISEETFRKIMDGEE